MRDPLFEPIKINQVEVKNRIYLPAMHLGMCVDFEVTDQIVEFYARRARGGAGMICVGFATVDEMAGNSLNIGAHKDEFIPGLTRLANGIKENGALACVQLNHAGRYNFSFFLDGKQPVAPSPIASNFTREVPQELSVDDIQAIVGNYAAAAARVKTAGFEAIDILAGTGYLISQFFSPLSNERKDEYGGSLENRMRFGLEVMQAIRKAVGPDFPLIMRMNGNDFMPGGQGRAELQQVAAAFVEKGAVDAFCINVGWHEARVPQIVTSVPRGVFAYMSRGIKEKVSVPVIASHRINDPDVARDLAIQMSLTDIDVRLKCPVDEDLIEQMKPDAVILATGAKPLIPPIPGIELAHVVQAWDVLNSRVYTGKRVVVIGGGAVGVEVALFLAEKGTLSAEAVKFLLVNQAEDPESIFELATRGTRDITVLEMIDKIGKDIGKSTRWGMLQELKRVGVKTNIETKALEITAEGVKVTSEQGEEVLPADTVILAAGSLSYNPLAETLAKAGIDYKVAGDAGQVGLAFDAVHQGFKAGCEV